MRRAFVDANIVLRYLTKDPPEMAEAVFKTFTSAQEGKILLLITSLTVAEVVWVLESYYRYSKSQVAETLTEFLLCDGLEVELLDFVIEALAMYQAKNLDFADAFLAVTALRKGPQAIYSFDRHFNRVDGLTVLKPT
jgi:predicted nucleic-acid-binding protein